ncbi:MAG TPA: hypothetical protein V6C58_02305 [Allocoleopsis sp.]
MLQYLKNEKRLALTDLDPTPKFPQSEWGKIVVSRKFHKRYKIKELMINNGVCNYICVEQDVQGNAVTQTFILPEIDLAYESEIEKEYRSFDVLLVNEAPIGVIKDFLLKFWRSTSEAQDNEVRKQYESKITSGKKDSLPNIIIDEKKVGGRFTGRDDFRIRMQNRFDEFPWRQFSEIVET